jgi:hypothetical protein
MIEAHSQVLMQIQATHERSRPPRALDHFKSFTRPRSHNTILIGALRWNGAVIKCRRIRTLAARTPEFFRQWGRSRKGSCVDGFKGHEQGSLCRCRVDAGYELPYSFAASDERPSAGPQKFCPPFPGFTFESVDDKPLILHARAPEYRRYRGTTQE